MRNPIPVLLFCCAAFAQQPRIVNARLESHAPAGGLQADLKRLAESTNGPEWAGYAVPMIAREGSMCCCGGGGCGGCSLEGRTSERTLPGAGPGTVKLEGPGEMLVLFRLLSRGIEKVRVHSIDCEIEAGGLPFHLLTPVAANESLSYLASIAPEHREAVTAIALHKDGAADLTLESLAAPNQPEKLRENVAFWLGSARGAAGFQALQRMLERDTSDRVREKVMFGLSVSKEPGAVPLLIESARTDRSPKVRGQALFWLAHKAGQRETAAISRALAEDPDTRVKKQAVFALQQLPSDEGIPLLIQVARGNANPEVRKQAIFWLGQSKDPRALKFFEEVLSK